jgi:hypothetical protein
MKDGQLSQKSVHAIALQINQENPSQLRKKLNKEKEGKIIIGNRIEEIKNRLLNLETCKLKRNFIHNQKSLVQTRHTVKSVLCISINSSLLEKEDI